MAITLAADALSDAEITDGIALGDLSSAARLWVRLWPTSLNAARELVGPTEAPGLAAEALIGTIATIAIGRGPREDVKPFLRGAVRELGDHGGPPPPRSAGAWSPDVSTSPIMSGAFARLPDLVQDLLWITVVGDRADELIADALGISTTAAAAVRIDALTTLQRDHLAAHADRVEDPACHRALHALAGAVEDPGAAGLSRETWMHLSACAWCTTAFHELVFSNAAIGALVDRAATPPPVVPPDVAPVVAGPEVEVADGGGLDEPTPADPPDEPPPRGRLHADVASSAPGFVRRHGRVLAGAAVVVAGAAVVALIVAGIGSDRSAPPEAAGPPTVTPTPAAGSALHGASPSTSDATETVGSTPGTVVGDLPSTTVTPRAPKSRTVAPPSPSATPTPQPSATAPSAEPPATSTPTPSPAPTPPPTPPSTPTPTPEPCSALAHLLGLC